MVKRIYRTETVQVYTYKIKKPLKIQRFTTVIVLKAGLEPARPLLTTGF
jgi:replication initiation and membrane attachment protein DnaB